MKLKSYNIFLIIGICLLIGIFAKRDTIMKLAQSKKQSTPSLIMHEPLTTLEIVDIQEAFEPKTQKKQFSFKKTKLSIKEKQKKTTNKKFVKKPVKKTMMLPQPKEAAPLEKVDKTSLDILAYNLQKQAETEEEISLQGEETVSGRVILVDKSEEDQDLDDESTALKASNFGVSLSINPETFFACGYNTSLLNNKHTYDKSVFIQTIMDAPWSLTLPAKQWWGRTDMTITPRINTLWGSADLAQTSDEYVKVGRAVTESKHSHSFDKIPLWIKESWIKLYTTSEKTSIQLGYFPKQIGMGLVLGNAYKVGQPLHINIEEKFVDQYRPGVQINSNITVREKQLETSVYYSMYNNNATSHETMAEFTQAQELQSCGDGPPFKKEKPFRTAMQMSHLVTAEIDIPVDVEIREHQGKIHFKPFFMYNKDKNQTVEFFGDASSSLFSVGTSMKLFKNKFHCDIDVAGNFGSQDVKAWDRNVTEEHARMTLTHLFAKAYQDIDDPALGYTILVEQSGSWVLSPTFPYPPGEDISLKYPAGAEFKNQDPSQIVFSFLSPPTQAGSPVDLNYSFKNSYSRFRKCYKNKFMAFMLAADGGYEISDRYQVGGILGYATGDDNPNDNQEKAYLYRLNKTWDTVRKDKCSHSYNGFQGIQSLYTGNNVRSMHLLRAHKLGQGLSQTPELTSNQITNMMYAGASVWINKNYSRGKLVANLNAIAIGQPHSLEFGLDPVMQDIYETFNFKENDETFARFKSYDKRLGQFLGLELNGFVEFFAKNNFTFYSMLSAFIPGSYYGDIARLSSLQQGKNVPFKNQRPAIAHDVSGFENAQRMELSLLNNIAFTIHAGVKFEFDTISLHQHRLIPKRRKKYG